MPKKEPKKSEYNSDNEVSLETMIDNTKKNMQEAEISMEFAGPEELENLEEKNERRKHSIDAMKIQMKEEHEERKNSNN